MPDDPRIRALEELIDSYENGKLKKDLASVRRQFLIEVSYTIGIPSVASILTALFASLAAVLAPVVVGAANIVDKLLVSKTIFSSYFKDRDALQARIGVLRAIVILARAESDTHKLEEMLKDGRQKALAYLEATD